MRGYGSYVFYAVRWKRRSGIDDMHARQDGNAVQIS